MDTNEEFYKVSIIIPVLNGEASIGKCLQALNQQTEPRENYEIIVVDDGSTDKTASIAATLCDRVITIDNSGPAEARNRGVQEAKSEIILFTDADCVPLSDWISKMFEPFEDPKIAGTKGAYLTRQTGWVAQFVQSEYESKYSYMKQFEFIDFIDTYSAGFRKSIFLELNGFDTRFPGASVEDQELSFRVAAAGHKMVFVPTARVYHLHAATISHYFRKKLNIGYWKTLVLKIHPDKVVRDSHTPQTLKLQLPLAYLLLLSILLISIISPIPCLILAFLFLITGYRETIQCLKKRYWIAAILSPVIMWIRAFGLGLGLVRGVIDPPLSKINLT